MTIDSVLAILSLLIAFGALVAGGLTKQNIAMICTFALVATTGLSAWIAYENWKHLSKVEGQVVARLANHRWTLDQIRAELNPDDSELVSAALLRAVEDGLVADQLTQCNSSLDGVLAIRVYFLTNSR